MTGIIPSIIPLILLFLAAVLDAGTPTAAAEREEFNPFFTVILDRTPYVSMVDLAETYRIDVSYDPVTLTMSLSRGTQRISVSNLSATLKFNNSPLNLGSPARLIRGAMYVPTQTFLPLLSRMLLLVSPPPLRSSCSPCL